MNILSKLWHRATTTQEERDEEYHDDIHRLERAQAYLARAQRETDIALRHERKVSSEGHQNSKPEEE